MKKGHSKAGIQIDESKHKPSTSALRRLKDALIAVVMGIVLVQIILWSWSWGSMFSSVILMADNILFIAFLVVCAVLGWFTGHNFISKLNNYMGYWKFW